MGLNAWAMGFGSKGKTAQTATATAITQQINGKPGGRLSILSIAATCANVATSLHVMTTLYASSIAAAGGASGATTITTVAFTAAPATAGNIVVVLDNGTYQWLTVASTASTTSVPISSALTGVSTLGAVYYLGLPTDTTGGVQDMGLTASAQSKLTSDVGSMFSAFKGAPALAYYLAASATALGSIDYITYAYTNV